MKGAGCSPLPALVLGLGLAVHPFAHPDHSAILAHYSEEIRLHPDHYKKRADRTWLLMKHGDPGNPAQEDIDTLLSHPDWKIHGMRLRAYRLFLLGRFDEAKIRIAENLREGADGPEQSRMLAKIELSRNDTGAAIEAYLHAWERRGDEDDFIELVHLHDARRKPPSALLLQALEKHPRSPAVAETAFESWMRNGGAQGLRQAAELAERAEKWWPRSVDWKIRYARALNASSRKRQAEKELLAALDLLDGDTRLSPGAGESSRYRKEIFALLEAVKE